MITNISDETSTGSLLIINIKRNLTIASDFHDSEYYYSTLMQLTYPVKHRFRSHHRLPASCHHYL